MPKLGKTCGLKRGLSLARASRYSIKNDSLEIGKTFVAFDENDEVVDYFTLTTAQIVYEDIPDEYRRRLLKYSIPSLRIARLAVGKNLQGKGIGKWLLAQSFIGIVHVAEITGLYLIIVDAKETSKSFYEHYGLLSSKIKNFLTSSLLRQ